MDKWLGNNTAAKIIALAVALILWAMVHVDTDTPTITRNTQGNQTIANLAIEPYGLDDEKYVLQSVVPQRISVEVAGQRSQITSLLPSTEYQVKMDLSRVTEPGQYTVPLQFDPPAGVELLSIEPSRVTVTIEEKVTQEFNAVILTTGVPADGFTELDPVFEEGNAVKVTLPESEMKQVQKIQGEMSVDGANESISGRVKLVAYANNGEVLDDAVITPAAIKVQIPISSNVSSVSSKTLPLNVSYSGDLPDGLVLAGVEAGANQVTLYGPKGVLEGMDSYPPVTLDLGEVKAEGSTRYKEALAAPDGIERIEPSSVEFTVNVVPFAEKTIENVPVALTGQTAGTDAKITDPVSGKMNVTVKGAPSRLAEITAADIGLTADLSGLNAGSHNVRLKVELPDYIRMDEASAPSVTVEIAAAAEETKPDTPVTTEPDNETAPPAQGTDEPVVEPEPAQPDPEETVEPNGETPNNTEQPGEVEETPPADGDEPTAPEPTEPTEEDPQGGGAIVPEPDPETGGGTTSP
ncbi:CdaR family protein [Saccharibacillus qingshengii]|uniref:CdaR family protein n=1 Tax=Saccharibacillus qingshengii TaxID=1763540 RepID=UPI001553D104|nr:CdaR family protein [Saccharibacillus qingshengii]